MLRWTFRQNGGAFALLPIYERNVQIKMKNLYLDIFVKSKTDHGLAPSATTIALSELSSHFAHSSVAAIKLQWRSRDLHIAILKLIQ